jgi:hypothetical protein
MWRRKIEQHRQINLFKAGLDSVSESNIDDHAKASAGDCRSRHEAQPAIFEFVADHSHTKRCGIERDAVVLLDSADVAKGSDD